MKFKSLDMFSHYLPPRVYEELLRQGGGAHMLQRAYNMPAMSDIKARIEIMRGFEGYRQLPSMVSPPVEDLVPVKHSASLARIINEEFGSICHAFPELFPGFVASVPMDDIDMAIAEAEYAIQKLGAKGIQIFTNIAGGPVDTPECFRLYKRMEELDAVVWLHPARTMKTADYPGEEYSQYELWWTIGWPIETTLAASRLVYSGIFEACPKLKIILHHAGALIPMLAGRLDAGLEKLYGSRTAPQFASLTQTPLTETALKAYKRFYADTATFGSAAAIACAISFFGVDHMVFGTDMPFDPEQGSGYISRTLRDIRSLDLSEEEKDAIRFGNAARLTGVEA